MRRLEICIALVVATLGLGAGSAYAATELPGWELTARTFPTNLRPGSRALVYLTLYNTGAAASSKAITLTDTLPAGLKATAAGDAEAESVASISGIEKGTPELGSKGYWNCQWTTIVTGATVVTCISNPAKLSVAPGEISKLAIAVEVEAGATSGSENQGSVSGGGALTASSSSDPVTVGSSPAPFGLTSFDGWFSNADGTSDTQAGSHPYEVTFSLDLASVIKNEPEFPEPSEEPRNIETVLPPGLVGDPGAVPECPRQLFDAQSCPASTQIGVDSVLFGDGFLEFPVYNIVPPPGEPAQFAFDLVGINTYLDASVRSGGDYGITEHVDNIAQRHIYFSSITLWGVPAEASHDEQREPCFAKNSQQGLHTSCPTGITTNQPFLTLPTACEGPQQSIARALSWENEKLGEASFLSHDAAGTPTGFTGCDRLSFGPSIATAPDTSFADTPAGLTASVEVPQEGLSSVEGLAASNIKDTTVTLPAGVAINPGQAAGLVACQSGEDGVGTEGPPSCPAASKVGTVKIKTPLLEGDAERELEGNVYVLQSDPPNLELLVAPSADGVYFKLIGKVHLDETTGQLTTTFAETPELPFTDFKLSFSGGAQAALTTPTNCGLYTANTDFTPWALGLPNLLTENSFAITSGTDGAACPPSPLPFGPSLTAGATTDQAGGFTDFSMLLQRADDQQRVTSLSFKTPPGLSGMISKVPLCDEADANAGTCPASSQIGHTVVAAGPGPYPLVVPQPGQPPAPIYLTGGYRGAPYGLSIVVPLHVGPFTLQTQVVRASISVDPHTAQLTVTTDPLPQIIDGIPTDLRSIDAVIDREGFMFNPTNCTPQSFSGTATGAEGASAPISSHFQVGSCQSLKFAPDFKVSTSGKTSKAGGASLTAKILYPTTPPGSNQASSQANIASVKVDLPKQLPSRLTTLQKACLAKVFESDPAACPKESVVGHATAVTPVLPVPLNGPAYFVSHGGEAFPSLIIVLQGYGVTVDLVGTTFISKAGITSSTFKQVPDVPISSFELVLPQGKYSALAANLPASAKGSFCGQKLVMPTAFVGQNGAEIHESTAIGVSGCARTKVLTTAQKLTAALKVCHKKAKGNRADCEKAARKRYPHAQRKKVK